MKPDESEIICLCGDHITIKQVAEREKYVGYCIGCDRQWTLTSDRPTKKGDQHEKTSNNPL